jgi:N-dimethylarginine dimethylaminohydrolase
MKILLCPPTYYDIEYEINPWMHIDNKVDHQKVNQEFQALKSLYQKWGVEVFELEARPGLPDMVYAANYGFVAGQTFIPARFRVPQRQGEVPHATEFFKNTLQYEVVPLPEGVFFEGQAELFKVGDRYVLGWGQRASYEAKSALEAILGKSIMAVELINPYYYHFDTCFAPLSADVALINPVAYSPDDYKKLCSLFSTVIETTNEDNKVMGCNLVVIDKRVVMAKGITEATKEKVAAQGFEVVEVDTTELLKGGGSVKCVTLEF